MKETDLTPEIQARRREAKGAQKRLRKLEKLIETMDKRAATLAEKLDYVERWVHKSSKLAASLLSEEEAARRSTEIESIYVNACRTVTPVRESLILISQVPRSGGTLLSQLLDGHPECHAHPYELQVGHRSKDHWPSLDLNDGPEMWFEVLREYRAGLHSRFGYEKNSPEVFPFLFLPELQRSLFLLDLRNQKQISERVIFDAYMTSYFNAWLNYYNRVGSKKAVTAFSPYLTNAAGSVEAFFRVYPDGRLISIVREPRSWLVSARDHFRRSSRVGVLSSLATTMGLWLESTGAGLRNKRSYGDRVLLLRFEDLISHTEAVMRHVASFIGIDFHPSLLMPTFNGAPIAPNSALETSAAEGRARHGIQSGPLERGSVLEDSERDEIEALTRAMYSEALGAVARF